MYRSMYLLAVFLMTFCIGRGFYRNSASKVTLVATTLGPILTRSTLFGCGIQLQNIFPELFATMVSFSSFQLVPIRKPLRMDVFFFTGYSVILGLLAMQPPVGLRSFATVPPDSLYRLVKCICCVPNKLSVSSQRLISETCLNFQDSWCHSNLCWSVFQANMQ